MPFPKRRIGPTRRDQGAQGVLSGLNLVAATVLAYDCFMKKWLAALACALPIVLGSCSNAGTASNVLPQQGQVAPDATATASPTPAPAPTLPATVWLYSGRSFGATGRFTPKRGDSSTGGNGQTVDGIGCHASMTENMFHIHSYVGVLVNGQWFAVPDAVGINGFGPLINGVVNAGYCFYDVHTHDDSGLIHQEAASTTPMSGSMFTLGNLLDIWGQPISGNGFASWNGVVRVFTATTPLRNLYASNYTEYLGDPRQIPLYSHEAVWIEVGPPYVEAANLPQVRFYTEY